MVTSLHSVGDDCTLPITPEYHVIPPKISQLPPPPQFLRRWWMTDPLSQDNTK